MKKTYTKLSTMPAKTNATGETHWMPSAMSPTQQMIA